MRFRLREWGYDTSLDNLPKYKRVGILSKDLNAESEQHKNAALDLCSDITYGILGLGGEYDPDQTQITTFDPDKEDLEVVVSKEPETVEPEPEPLVEPRNQPELSESNLTDMLSKAVERADDVEVDTWPEEQNVIRPPVSDDNEVETTVETVIPSTLDEFDVSTERDPVVETTKTKSADEEIPSIPAT